MKIYDVFIDFDRTLYNSDQLYNMICKICNGYGLTMDHLDYCYEKCFESPILFNYITLIKYAANAFDLPSESILKEVRKLIMYHGTQFVYKDSFLILDYFSKIDKLPYLITYGDIQFQEMKIAGSRLQKYFKDIIITNEYKWLHKIFSNRNIIIIDDNPREISSFREHYPKSLLIEIKRDGTKYCDQISGKADYMFTHLDFEIINYFVKPILTTNYRETQ